MILFTNQYNVMTKSNDGSRAYKKGVDYTAFHTGGDILSFPFGQEFVVIVNIFLLPLLLTIITETNVAYLIPFK